MDIFVKQNNNILDAMCSYPIRHSLIFFTDSLRELRDVVNRATDWLTDSLDDGRNVYMPHWK